MAKSKDSDGAKAAIAYQRLVNDGLFFANDSYQQLSMLYEAYKEHPKLTAATAREMDGEEFDAQAIAPNSLTMHQALYEGHHPLLQACMFFEHRARLALLKTAIDLTLERPSGLTLAVVDPGGDIDWNLFLIHTLPSTFKAGQAWLAEQPNSKLYATFWQQFLWGWGGFYLEHRKEEEFAWMSEYSGIPVDEIPTALQAFDKFFPIGGWIAKAGWSDIMVVRMVPWYFQGLGAAYRRVKYGADKFSDLAGTGYTATDLSRRMTLTRDFLST